MGWSESESNAMGFRVNDSGTAQVQTRQYEHNFFTGGVRNDSGFQWRNAEGGGFESYFEKNPETGNYSVASQETARAQTFAAVAKEVGSYSAPVETMSKGSIAVASLAAPVVGGVSRYGTSLVQKAASLAGKGKEMLNSGMQTLGAKLFVASARVEVATASASATVAANADKIQTATDFFAGMSSGSTPANPVQMIRAVSAKIIEPIVEKVKEVVSQPTEQEDNED